jgi:stage II sporulation protein AB (anti-sigma F factor)
VDKESNSVKISMRGLSVNESFARMAAAAFVTPLDPAVAELEDMKTAVSEAVTNAIIHGYPQSEGEVRLAFTREGRDITIEVSDDGTGIADIEAARAPLFTTKPELERSGLGFTVMENFMDSVEVISAPGNGTTVILRKKFSLVSGA